MIIPRGRGIILSGNRQIAGQFVQIAKRRAMEFAILLDMANLKMGHRKYMLDRDCVWCTINIIDNATFIRIHSCFEAKCGECGTISILPSNLTPLSGEPLIGETPDLIEMTANAGGCWDPEHDTWEVYAGYIVDFGDGTGGYTGTMIYGTYTPIVKHWYREPGAYTIISKAWNRQTTSTGRPTELTRTTYNKVGPWIDWNDHYGEGQASANVANAACAALPWSVIEPVSGDLWYSGHKLKHNTTTSYKVYMRKTVWTWNLSDEDFYRTQNPDTGAWETPQNAQYWISSSVTSVRPTSGEHVDMGEEDSWWHQHQRVDEFKIVINGTPIPCQTVDGAYIGMLKDLTNILPPLIKAGGTLTIEFTEVNDFATAPPFNVPYRSGTQRLRQMGWSSYKVFFLSTANPACVTHKTQTALINAT
jgi:hypothetical protein